jgi:hypothetical protein
MSRLISRNPFARHELHSEVEHVNPSVTCSWCGRRGRWLKSGLTSLKAYFLESDSGRTSYLTGKFCSLDCCRAYHNLDEV